MFKATQENTLLMEQIREIFNTVDHKWTQHYKDNPLSTIHPDYNDVTLITIDTSKMPVDLMTDPCPDLDIDD